MCVIIPADVLLAFALLKRDKISFEQIQILRETIETQNPNIILDISFPSIDLALYYYPKLFHKHGQYISRSSDFPTLGGNDYIENEFLNLLNPEIKSAIEKSL